MSNPDSTQELQDAIAYLKKVTGQILTYEQYRRQHLEQHSRKHDQQIGLLTQSAQSLSGSANRIVGEVAKGVREQARDSLSAGFGEEFGRVHEAANGVIGRMNAAAAELARQSAVAAADRRKTAWIALGALAVGAALAAVGGGAWLWHAAREARRIRMEAHLVRAFNAADVLACGDRLCVNIDPERRQTIGGKTYYLARPRR